MKRYLKENRAVHCLGNGHVCGYVKGLDMFQAFGPHYSAPNALSMSFASEGDWQIESEREPETAIWTHTLYNGNDKTAVVEEFADGTRPVLYRRIRAAKKLCFTVGADKVELLSPVDESICGLSGFFTGEIPNGAPFYIYSISDDIYRGFVTDRALYVGLTITGDAGITRIDKRTLKVEIADGEIAIAFGQRFEEMLDNLLYAKETSWDVRKNETAERWRAFSRARKANMPRLSEELEKMSDDVYVMIKTQQSCSGGVLAGYPYHLAYIRDSSGVLKGLLSLGAFDEARALIRFYIDIFDRYGEFHNAQGTDSYGFHIHEIDKTEITGYMVLMIIGYYRRTGDRETLLKAKNLLMWCVEQQHSILRGGMLPFNGDETYIAGFLLPREVIDHGSAEATALYHTGCLRLLELADELKLDNDQKALLKKDAETIAASYADNFYVDGKIACNNLHYYGAGERPKFRTGVRLCGHGMGVGTLDKSGRYVCWECCNNPPRENKEYETVYYLTSPILSCLYVGAVLPDRRLTDKVVDEIAEELVKNNFVYKPEKTVGYDIGILIHAFRERHSDLIPRLKQMVLDMRDEYGTWSEYYVNNLPNGTMYRPWESGINCEALINN